MNISTITDYVTVKERQLQAMWPLAWVTLTVWPHRFTFTGFGLPNDMEFRVEGGTIDALIGNIEGRLTELKRKNWTEHQLGQTLGLYPEDPRECEVVVLQDPVHEPA